MSKCKISIIVPIYNVENYLRRCLDSLINQSLTDIEIILVNDGSPDRSYLICDEYAKLDSRIKVINKENEGLGLARNRGLEVAVGEYIAFVDSDDFVELDMYKKLYDSAQSNGSDVVFCNFNEFSVNKVVYPNMEVSTSFELNGRDEIFYFLTDMIGAEPSYHKDRKYSMSVWRAIYSRDIIVNNNVKFPSERELISEDVVFHVRFLSKINKLSYLTYCGYYYCENETSLTKTFRSDRFEKYKILHSELLNLLNNCYPDKLDIGRLSVDRLFLGYVRRRSLSIETSIDDLKNYVDDDYLLMVSNRYPCFSLPLKHFIFLLLLKYKMYRTIYYGLKHKSI